MQKLRSHPGPTESESPGLGTTVCVLTSFPGILRSPDPSETMRSRTIDLLLVDLNFNNEKKYGVYGRVGKKRSNCCFS